jgi:pimeloyl-ACP methyl ester carboxylesterase
MDFIEINGAGLRYEVTGEGPRRLVLLHEMAGTLESYDELLPLVTPGRQVLRYDWRGAGMSERATGTLSLETLTDDLFALLDRLGWDRDVALCGAAVGGAIALNAASRNTARIKAVVAMSPATGYEPARRADIIKIADAIEAEGMRLKMEPSMDAVYPVALRTDPLKFERYRARWLGTDPQSYAAAYRMLAGLDLKDAFARIKCPVLILSGEQDGIRPPALMQQVAAQIATAHVDTVPGGHVMALQAPRPVAAAIENFLKPKNL